MQYSLDKSIKFQNINYIKYVYYICNILKKKRMNTGIKSQFNQLDNLVFSNL